MKKILYPLFAILDVLFTLLTALFVNWWAPLFAITGTVCDGGTCRPGATLPRWLAWFDTFDADLDTGNRDRYGNKGFWGRVLWLYRNNSYGFNYWALGIPFDPKEWTVDEFRDENGVRTFRAHSSRGHFNVYTVKFGLRIKIGWKAWNMYDPAARSWKSKPWGPEWRIPFVFSISKA